MPLLNPGDQFPELTLTPPDGSSVRLPEAFAGKFGVVLFFRGSWRPYCNAQLQAFQRAAGNLAESGAIGRLVPEDVLGLVRYLREHAAA